MVTNKKELFQLIKENIFPDIDVEKVLEMTPEAYNTFLLEQLERLFSGTWMARNAPAWLSDLFFTAHKGRKMNKKTKLILLAEEAEETDDSNPCLDLFYQELAGLCHDLALHYPFNPQLLGIHTLNQDFLYKNKSLREWIESTPYQHVAVQMAWIMRNEALNEVTYFYQPAQDYLAEIYTSETGLLQQPYDLGSRQINPDLFIKTIMSHLKTLDEHVTEGKAMGYCMEEIILHDELLGFLDDGFLDWMTELVHELYQTMQQAYEQMDLTGFNPELPLREQKKKVLDNIQSMMTAVFDKAREQKETHELGNWVEDSSLEKNYLADHMLMKVYGVYNTQHFPNI